MADYDHNSTISMQRFDTTEPYNVPNRKERSRELAQKRRTTYKTLMKDLADELPFSKEVVSQVDYNSRLRLALCFFRMKMLAPKKESSSNEESNVSFHRGLLQDLVTESLDGFIMVMSGDSSLIYISESIHKHLGLFQSEHIGLSIYELIHEDDHRQVKKAIADTESKILSNMALNSGEKKSSSIECSFFCRMKCSRFKVSNTATKCPGYKLVFISGHYKIQGKEPCLFAIVRPVSPPSILEITMEGNMFVTHYSMEMKCIFFDGRLRNLMGYEKPDLVGHVPFEFHHHEDVEANLECSRGLMEKGEGLSGYYRYLNKFGVFVWVQSRATMMFDSRTGKPSYIVCMNYVISREKGEKCLEMRRSIAAKETPPSITESTRSHDPFPVPRDDGKSLNPFDEAINSPMSVNLDSTARSPVSSFRSISPDSTELHPLESVSSSIVTDKSNDSGYYNRLSHESTSSMPAAVPTTVSPTPSFSDSAIGSDYSSTNSPENVFSSPAAAPTEVHDIKIESCSPPPLIPSKPIGLLTLLSDDTPHTHQPYTDTTTTPLSCNQSTGNAYNITTPHSTTTTAYHPHQQQQQQYQTTLPQVIPPQAPLTTMLPFTHQPAAPATYYRPASYFPIVGQEPQHQYITTAGPTPQLPPTQHPLYMAPQTVHETGGYSFPVAFNTRPQFITHSVTGFVTTSVFPQPTMTPSTAAGTNILPILNAEDVQFLNVAKITPGNPVFHSPNYN